MDDIKVFTKNGVYTGFEYAKMMRRKHAIKQGIKWTMFNVLCVIMIIFRAYVFFTYHI